MTARRPTQEHTTEQQPDGSYRCSKCLVSYKARPYRRDCQGIPRYNVRKERPVHLFTKSELKRKDKQPGSEPEGYVKMLNAPYWVYLYDAGKAVPLVEPEVSHE
jgi:hypothetical protein